MKFQMVLRQVAWYMLAVIGAVCHAAEPPPDREPLAAPSPDQELLAAAELSAGAELEVEIPAGSTRRFALTLPVGMAGDVEVTQRAGFVDVELQGGGEVHNVRTESGLLGRMQATLLASESGRWLLTLRPRKGRGAGTVGIRVSTLRQAGAADRLSNTTSRPKRCVLRTTGRRR